jgi:hypothetical protein
MSVSNKLPLVALVNAQVDEARKILPIDETHQRLLTLPFIQHSFRINHWCLP